MKVGTENKKQLYTAGVLGFLALLALYPIYNTFFGGPSTPPPQAPPVIHDVTTSHNAVAAPTVSGKDGVVAPPGYAVGPAAQKVGSVAGELDPTLHMGAMLVTESLKYTGTGRNIFSGVADAPPPRPAVKLVKADFGARPVLPPPPPPPQPTGPPPKPPINLKFFGTEINAAGVRRAFLLQGDDVFLASPGDVVQRRYRVVSISANSIQVEDIPNANTQGLPLLN